MTGSLEKSPLALGHLRIIDLGENIASQYCSRLFSDFGADVILVEPPGGSATRRIGPFRANGDSQLFLHLNLGKRSITADRSSSAGWEHILDLAKNADVILVPPGADRKAIAGQNDQAVICLISDFGEDGPRAAWRGGEMIHQALSGVMYRNGRPDREPLYGVGHRASYTSGVAAYTAALSAIFARQRLGRGQEITIDVCETAASMTYGMASQYFYNGVVDSRSTAPRLPSAVVRCLDGWLSVFIYDYRWRDTWAALGAPEMATDPRFANVEDRMDRWPEVVRLIERQTENMRADDVVRALQSVGAIAAKAATPADLAVSDHLKARDYWEQIDTPEGPRRILGAPFRMSATPRIVRGDAPRLNPAHNRDAVA
ncbi:CaiB/BaiF CoA transferase family protein [Pseudorhodoplanes sp.]|uniref:CaiB/BaiF CoA transferase family protein n=1 Tax=Pseudorhodoplanes sp. TaxID=1934341 RepID=UPI002BDF49C5|nr:CoA transferase [Pseudorhodoplanes sp.]HWV54660.1 CoA transferase [Pseudorhodoplanes sp.]